MVVESKNGLAGVLPLIHETALELLDSTAVRISDCLGLALSLPSLVDFRNARIASTNDKYADATSIDLHGWCKEHFNLPLVIENDARAALCGEHFCGAAEGFSDVLLLTLGTGIGSAVFVDGIPYRTRHLQGGNLGGHIPVSLHGRTCTCGATGCMEAEASSWSLPAITRDWPRVETSALSQLTHVNFRALFQCADSGDPIAQQIVDHCILVWSCGHRRGSSTSTARKRISLRRRSHESSRSHIASHCHLRKSTCVDSYQQSQHCSCDVGQPCCPSRGNSSSSRVSAGGPLCQRTISNPASIRDFLPTNV